MPAEPHSKPSFSTGRRWSIGLNVLLVMVVVLTVVVMVNYLSRDYSWRFQCSTNRKFELSPRTVNLVKAMTNQVKVTIYYNKEDPLYTTVASLLKEYHQLNPKISVQTVDFSWDYGAAQKIKTQYSLGSATDKNLVIFDCNGRSYPVDGKALAEYSIEPVPNSKENPYRIKTTAFKGEMMFTGALLKLMSHKDFKACALQGHGEHQIDNGDQRLGFLKFKSVLQQHLVQVEPLSLLGTNQVPADCNLLIIAGPTATIPDNQLVKIEQYLNQGGRLLALFNAETKDKVIGLEKILANWGVAIGDFVVEDPDNNNSKEDLDVIVSAFTKHAVVNPITDVGLYLIRPRPIGRLTTRSSQAADAAHVEPLAYSGPKAYNESDAAKTPHQFPFMVAVEKGAIKGVVTERGATRMIIAGDSLFLANGVIDSLANREFAGYAVNWLLDRKELLEGLGPKPLPEHRLLMTQTQLQRAQWLLLGAMPGSVLLMGGMVWLRRRR
jgi:ABC-type uncharacterized transport system involved in gliding motility auxiliary subunit